jgi:hypothetical protein
LVIGYIREAQIAARVERDQVYATPCISSPASSLVGLFCDAPVRPVASKGFLKDGGATLDKAAAAAAPVISSGVELGGWTLPHL